MYFITLLHFSDPSLEEKIRPDIFLCTLMFIHVSEIQNVTYSF